jgi:ATP-binding cassette subfamily C (CFTR/MRP) protein 1
MTVVEENLEDPTKIILNGSVSYISQLPWIQNATLRNNIIFNLDYEEIKYNKIIDLCELKNDLQSLVGGDMTEIGEKGINLSGGQKARVAIARGIYCNNDIYLLDDPISALDSHVGQNIMKNVIMDYLRNKTRVLVTHALQYLSNCDRIIVMSNGTIKWEGSYEELITKDFYNDYVQKLKKNSSTEFSEQNHENKEEEEKTNKDSLETLIDSGENEKIIKEKKKEEISRITKEEDKEEGKVKLSVYYKYIQYSGGLFVFFGVFLSKFTV